MSFPNSQSQSAGAIPVYQTAQAQGGATPKNITANASTQVKTGSGTFYGLSTNTGGTTSTATVYDGTSAAGVKIGTYATTAVGGPVLPSCGIAFSTGLFVVTAGSASADITVVFE